MQKMREKYMNENQSKEPSREKQSQFQPAEQEINFFGFSLKNEALKYAWIPILVVLLVVFLYMWTNLMGDSSLIKQKKMKKVK